MTARVLYIESAPQAGGSTISLFELVRRLDRQTFGPVVLLCAHNPYAGRFAGLGIPVITTAQYCSVRTPAYPSALAQVRRSGWADRLRANRLTRTLWRMGGLVARTVLHTWPLARTVAATIREQRIDLVHLNDAPELHKAGIIASRLAGVPCVCHVRSMPPLDALDRLLARYVAHFIFISRAVEQDQRAKGLAARPGTVVYNALDLAAYAQPPDRQAARRAFGVGDDDLVVGSMARLEPWKGQRHLLAALARLAPRFPTLCCLIAGEPERDGAWYKDELIESVERLGLQDIVRFVGYQDDVPRFLAALDVLAHTSVQPEPFGRVLIEAMAAGVPVVASNSGGVPEIVVDGETGLLVPAGEPEALAQALADLLADPPRRQAMGERGKQRAALFDIAHHAAAVETIYRSVLGLP